ncbi:MAG: hypothetical protein AB7J40_03565 [Candidatus Altimarinota bacterium]
MINEVLRSADEPKKKLEKDDVRKEAKGMVERHERQLSELKAASGEHSESFEQAALKASEQFQQELRGFLKENQAEELYDELVKPVRDQVSKIMGEHFANSVQ